MHLRKIVLAAALLSPIALPLSTLRAAPGSADGAAVFKQRCVMCHGNVAGKRSPLGPNLVGVVGRKAGTGDYIYSPAMKGSGIVWDQASIVKYLAGPIRMVPGSRMPTSVTDANQRAALAAYLATLK